MDITQEKVDDLNAIIKITIAPEDYSPRVEKALKDQAKKANLPGFRKGMVPVAHIKKMYGKSILVEEINNTLNETLSKHLTEPSILGKSISGGHDLKNFESALQNSGGVVLSKVETSLESGIYVVKYRTSRSAKEYIKPYMTR